jgi:proteasome lid subunit RPN8/RPN11
MSKIKIVVFQAEIFNGVLNYAMERHPNEIFLLLRGKISGQILRVKEFVIPPFAIEGEGFASFSPWFLPYDPSIVGTLHSHPSGSLKPSAEDLNHFYGEIMVILAYPYESENDAAAYTRSFKSVKIEIEK